MRKLLVTGAIAAASLATAAVAIAAGTTPHPPHKHWHFQARSAPTTAPPPSAAIRSITRSARPVIRCRCWPTAT